ncbi:hypothetical protein IGI65_001068 [Enterococcus sp. DIV0755b]|uniref:glycosyltransferase n=1 Tax=Enterococcus sp. DIV0755b TaxID=2774657 RepID=UPI003F20B643
MKKIIFIVNYLTLDEEGGNSRFLYLAKKMLKKYDDLEIEIITSNFLHSKKTFRYDKEKNITIEDKNLKITFLSTIGYEQNISLKRILSNKVFARSVFRYLKKMKDKDELPNLIYFSVPSLEYGAEIIDFSKQNNIFTIADIQDIWPEAFEMVSPFPEMVNKVLFFNSRRLSKKIYSQVDYTVAVSNTYGKIVDKYRKMNSHTKVVYLGSDFRKFDKYFNKKNETNDVIRFTYVGTLGHSYDLNHVLDAFSIVKNLKKKIELHIFGDGPLKESLEKKTKELEIEDIVTFYGRLPYLELVNKLGEMDVAINPIRDGAAQSIINKVGDYAAAGLPVINTQENLEYRNLVDSWHIGINTFNNTDGLKNAIIEIIGKSKSELKLMGENNRLLGESLFDRRITYDDLAKMIRKVVDMS